MIVHFVPDGKTKTMSNLASEVDQKKLAGKGADSKANAKAEIVPAGKDGELSKKQLAKLAKKEKKAGLKESGGDASAQQLKGPPADKGQPAAKPQFVTIPTSFSFFGGPLADYWENILEER